MSPRSHESESWPSRRAARISLAAIATQEPHGSHLQAGRVHGIDADAALKDRCPISLTVTHPDFAAYKPQVDGCAVEHVVSAARLASQVMPFGTGGHLRCSEHRPRIIEPWTLGGVRATANTSARGSPVFPLRVVLAFDVRQFGGSESLQLVAGPVLHLSSAVLPARRRRMRPTVHSVILAPTASIHANPGTVVHDPYLHARRAEHDGQPQPTGR